MLQTLVRFDEALKESAFVGEDDGEMSPREELAVVSLLAICTNRETLEERDQKLMLRIFADCLEERVLPLPEGQCNDINADDLMDFHRKLSSMDDEDKSLLFYWTWQHCSPSCTWKQHKQC